MRAEKDDIIFIYHQTSHSIYYNYQRYQQLNIMVSIRYVEFLIIVLKINTMEN